MIEWLKEDLELLKDNSLNEVGSNESESIWKSIIIAGPVNWIASKTDDEILRTIDADERLCTQTESGFLYSVWNVVVLHIYKKDYFSIYQCYYNWPENQVIGVSTGEYSYRDIVSVWTSESNKTVVSYFFKGDRGEQNQVDKNLDGVEFRISLKTGESFQVFMHNSVKELVRDAYNAVEAIHEFIRLRK